MYAPVFQTISASATVKALIGSNPVRLYMFGYAPQGVTLPYAVWQQITGSPENYLGDTPDLDKFITQIDVYALTEQSARDVAKALSGAIEPVAYITAWRGESTDPKTLHKRFSFDVDWHVKRT